MSILKSYLTSLEPDMYQTVYSQSLGGYCSKSLLYKETTLQSTIGLYDTSISLDTPSDGWSGWQNVEYINIGNEIIKVSPITNGTVSVVTRGYNGLINMHIDGDEVMAVSASELFNNVFNDDRNQYRCIAIKNNSLTDTAFNFEAYIKQNSRNSNSSIKISLEKPESQYLDSTSTSWNSMQVIDISLIGLYPDNHFNSAYLKIKSGTAEGQGGIISSFDSSTGTFTFYSSFSSSFDFLTNVDYEVLPSPAQRVKTGTIAPSTSDNILLPFVSNSSSSPIRFESGNISSPVICDLLPNDIVYLWLERNVEKGSDGFIDNDVVINIKYDTSG